MYGREPKQKPQHQNHRQPKMQEINRKPLKINNEINLSSSRIHEHWCFCFWLFLVVCAFTAMAAGSLYYHTTILLRPCILMLEKYYGNILSCHQTAAATAHAELLESRQSVAHVQEPISGYCLQHPQARLSKWRRLFGGPPWRNQITGFAEDTTHEEFFMKCVKIT